MLIKEIKANAKKEHDLLTRLFYNPPESLPVEDRITKEEFDLQHAKVWADMEAEIKTAEDYIEPVKPRDLAKEIDAIKADILSLKSEVIK